MSRIAAKAVITTHMNADLDGFSSMIAASLLYPDAILVLPDTCEPALQMLLNHSLLKIPALQHWNEIDIGAIKRIILVDAYEPRRIGRIGEDLGKMKGLEWIIYDTHPVQGAPPGAEIHQAPYGATTTLLVLDLDKRGVHISSFMATILALGIYEDTGLFNFVGTTAEDFQAASILFRAGAEVRLIRDVLQIHLGELQQECFRTLAENLEELPVQGPTLFFSGMRYQTFIPDLALVVHRLMDEHPMEVLFVALEVPDHVYVIARSRSRVVNVGRVLERLGGGGHAFAASASLKGRTLIEVKEALISSLEELVSMPIKALNIMTTPVRSVPADATIQMAAELMNRLRINALPVTRNDEIVGVITRQVVDQALPMGLSKRCVEDMMDAPPPLFSPDTTPDQIAKTLMEHRARIALIGTDYHHVQGLVTRMDLLRSNYDLASIRPIKLARPMSQPPNYWRRIEKLLPPQRFEQVKVVGELAKTMNLSIYLVGGTARDIIMEHPPKDIDIVVEGDAIPLAEEFARVFVGRNHPYPRFGTSVVLFPDGTRVDFATARTESYARPGSPPQVEVGTMIRQDLYRRDFTINALAICLNPEKRGRVLDFYGSLRDIHDGTLRVLHSLSFFEDPARILRAIRFAGRFGFRLSRETEHLMRQALGAGVLKKVAGPRIGLEMRYLLMERAVPDILRLLMEYDVFPALHPEWVWRLPDLPSFRPFIEAMDWYRVNLSSHDEDRWLYWAMVLFRKIRKNTRKELALWFHWPNRAKDELMNYQQKLRGLQKFSRKGTPKPTPGDVLLEVRNQPWTWVLYAMACAREPLKSILHSFLARWKDYPPLIHGNDLLRLGWAPGPHFRRVLDEVWKLQVNGLIDSREKALEWVKNLTHKKED